MPETVRSLAQRAPRRRRAAQQPAEPEPEPEPSPSLQFDEGSGSESDGFEGGFSDEDHDGQVSVISVGGRCYRKRAVTYSRATAQTWDTPDPADRSLLDDEPDCAAAGFAEEEMTATFSCPPEYHRFFVGKGGATQRRLEAETGARLSFPPPGSGEGGVGIAAPSDGEVESMIGRLEILALTAKQSLPPTHFLNLPLGRTPAAAAALDAVRAQALELGEGTGMEAGMVTRASRFHLTLATLKLYTPAEIRSAVAALESVAPSLQRAAADSARAVRLQGVEIMNDDPAMADVLYLRVAEDDGAAAVNRLALAAAGAMLTAGCLTMDEAAKQWLVDGEGALVPPKLHATLVNSKRRAPGTARKPIDARPLLEGLGSASAVCGVEELHLSRMAGPGGAGPAGRGEAEGRQADGYYAAEHVVRLRAK